MEHQFDRSLIMTLLAEESLERTADYVRRGRSMSSIDVDQLKARWVDQVQVFIADPADRDTSALVEDIESELAIRRVELPREEVREAAITLLRRTLDRTQSLSRAEIARLNDDLARDCERHRAARGPRQ